MTKEPKESFLTQAPDERVGDIRRWRKRLDNKGSTWSHERVGTEFATALEAVDYLLSLFAAAPTLTPDEAMTELVRESERLGLYDAGRETVGEAYQRVRATPPSPSPTPAPPVVMTSELEQLESLARHAIETGTHPFGRSLAAWDAYRMHAHPSVILDLICRVKAANGPAISGQAPTPAPTKGEYPPDEDLYAVAFGLHELLRRKMLCDPRYFANLDDDERATYYEAARKAFALLRTRGA